MMDDTMAEVLRAKSPAERLAIANEMWRSARRMNYQMGGSEKHLRDIAGVFKIQGPRLDLSYLDADGP
jgi:hypothetical protein